ncbi:TraR/DksA C4-type zinc finger protein [Pseudomonas sp. HLMP]|uniref:TraR/DksA C4-type zinc finger protein n=1 Tax=Pseudomonas sp. HLMP TaxID=3153767 RepID=UPI003966C9DB
MADAVDMANDQAEYFLQAALRHQAGKQAGPSAQFCEDCDEPIPLLRQQAVAGCETCVSCQELRERCR